MRFLSLRRASKLKFYSTSFAQRLFIPDAYFRSRLAEVLGQIKNYDPQVVHDRVDYYNKLDASFDLPADAVGLKSIPFAKQTAYYCDMRSVLRYFPKDVRVKYLFGDVREIMAEPTFVKSRPISDDNGNSILLKLNRVRHFIPIRDKIPYGEKKDILVWRGVGWQPRRKAFLREFWNHPLCDVGQVNPPSEAAPAEWVKPRMTVDEQLRYKFILSIEGNDVATNLKWIAQSDSLCFMVKPKYETWLMEGRLVPGVHYVQLRDDYADLPEKIEHYRKHSDEALAIIQNFKDYFRQFLDIRLEKLVPLLVARKYLELSGQLSTH